MLAIKTEVLTGSIREACAEAIELAEKLGMPVRMEFNDIPLLVHSRDTVDGMERVYNRLCEVHR